MIKQDHDWLPEVSRVPEMPRSTQRASPDLPAVYLFKKRAWLRLVGMYALPLWMGAGFLIFTDHDAADWQFWAFTLPLILLVALHTTIVTDAARESLFESTP